ncbi:MAG: ATP-dependent zinc protease [Chloroflexi bacterium]|nr:ATP-dependent zinc protease [Chloroflexota bacterium]
MANERKSARAKRSMASGVKNRRVLGWREWASLPGLGIAAIKAKLDTGAKTSALHAWDLSLRMVEGRQWIRFRVHPMQRDKVTSVVCEAPVSDQRWVMNSSGTRERRYIITTNLQIGSSRWPIELSLANRDAMGFPMIIGREAMRDRLIVDPHASYRAGRKPRQAVNGASKDQGGPKAGRADT